MSEVFNTTTESATSPIAMKQCRYGQMVYLRRDQYVGRSLELYGEFSELEAIVFSHALRPNEVAVEIGANIGAHTVHLAKLVGPGGLVLAFEPQRVPFQILCANVVLNNHFNVRTYHSAVGREAGTLKVRPLDYTATNNFGGLSLIGTTEGEDVPVITLDSLDLPSLQLLKIDVEGMEADVLLGGQRAIARHRPIMYVENDRKEKSPQLISLIKQLGYAMWWHFPRLYNPGNYAGRSENVFQNEASINLLCIPQEVPLTMDGWRKVSGPEEWWEDLAP